MTHAPDLVRRQPVPTGTKLYNPPRWWMMARQTWGIEVMKWIIASAVLVTGSTTLAQQNTPSFCARLAPQIGLHAAGAPGLYEGRLISGLKAAFIGGSASIAFGVESVGDVSPGDEAALRKACSVKKAEYRCVVDRPMVLMVSSSKGDGRVEAQPGEKALVTTKGMRVRCADGVIS